MNGQPDIYLDLIDKTLQVKSKCMQVVIIKVKKITDVFCLLYNIPIIQTTTIIVNKTLFI